MCQSESSVHRQGPRLQPQGPSCYAYHRLYPAGPNRGRQTLQEACRKEKVWRGISISLPLTSSMEPRRERSPYRARPRFRRGSPDIHMIWLPTRRACWSDRVHYQSGFPPPPPSRLRSRLDRSVFASSHRLTVELARRHRPQRASGSRETPHAGRVVPRVVLTYGQARFVLRGCGAPARPPVEETLADDNSLGTVGPGRDI